MHVWPNGRQRTHWETVNQCTKALNGTWLLHRARKQLGDIFAKVIRERKARGAQEDDLLQVFIDAKYQRVNGGRATTEQECTGLMIAGLFAGQHTSSVVSSWTGYYMLGNKVRSSADAVCVYGGVCGT